MQTLARACVPDAPCNMPPETEAVVERLIRHLVPLLDAGSQMDSLDAAGPADMALVRLTSSEALLRLARLHDSRIYPEVYMAPRAHHAGLHCPLPSQYRNHMHRHPSLHRLLRLLLLALL